jgi:hypothetical protein
MLAKEVAGGECTQAIQALANTSPRFMHTIHIETIYIYRMEARAELSPICKLSGNSSQAHNLNERGLSSIHFLHQIGKNTSDSATSVPTLKKTETFASQSRQSARLFLQSSVRIGTPPPHPQASVSPPFGLGGGGVGGTQFRRGERHCGTLGIYVFCDLH